MSVVKRPQWGAIKVLICLDNPTVRTMVRDALRDFGLDQINSVQSFEVVQDSIGLGTYDLLILGEVIEGKSSLPLIHRLRNGELGPHPFPLVLLVVQPTAPVELIREAINSGPDDLLVMPFAIADFQQRIERMADSRKPFVITYHYSGPDRRKQDRIDASPAPALVAPNPLVMKGVGGDYDAAVKLATESYHSRIGRAGDRMIASLLTEGVTLCKQDPAELARIEKVAVDIAEIGMKLSGRTIGQIDDRVRAVIRDFVSALAALRSADHARHQRIDALGQLFQRCLDSVSSSKR